MAVRNDRHTVAALPFAAIIFWLQVLRVKQAQQTQQQVLPKLNQTGQQQMQPQTRPRQVLQRVEPQALVQRWGPVGVGEEEAFLLCCRLKGQQQRQEP